MKNAPYELSPATSEEAEMLNDKINAFVAQQVSLHGDTEVLKDYVIKENHLNDPECGEATVWLCKKTLPMDVQT